MKSFLTFVTEKFDHKQREGESEIVHHITDINFPSSEFDPLSHFGTHKAARARAYDKNPLGFGLYHHVGRIKLGKVVHIEDKGNNHTMNLVHALHDAGHISLAQHQKIHRHYVDGSDWEELQTHLLNTLRDNHINTIAYKNQFEDERSTSYMITHPSQFRPIHHFPVKHINMERSKGSRS